MSTPDIIPAWEGRSVLRFQVETATDALEAFWDFCDWLDTHQVNRSSSFRFFYYFGRNTNDLRHQRGLGYEWLTEEVDDAGDEGFSIPLHLIVIASNEQLALDRLHGIEEAIQALVADKYLPVVRWGLVELIPSSAVERVEPVQLPGLPETSTDRLDTAPMVNIRNLFFPFETAWFDDSDTGGFTEDVNKAIRAFDEWLFLNPGTDDLNEAVTSLEVVARSLPDVESNTQLPNWVIISTHHALQGFMALVLAGTDDSRLAVLVDAIRLEDWRKDNPKGGTPPKRRAPDRDTWHEYLQSEFHLPFFSLLYRGIKMTDFMLQFMDSKVFEPEEGEDEAVARLDKLRNDFVHFRPRLTIYHDNLEFPALIRTSISIAHFLAFEPRNVTWRDARLKERAEAAFEQIDALLIRIQQRYDAALALMQPLGEGFKDDGSEEADESRR